MLVHRLAVKVAFFVNGFIYANWASRLTGIQELYHIDNGVAGMILLVLSLGAVLAMPFTGWIILKNGSRRITLFSVFLYCAIVPFIPLMQHVVGLGILFFMMGIVTGMLDVAMNAQAVMVEQQYKKPIMTSFHALFSIGMACGGWTAALFVKFNNDLFHQLLSVACLALIAVVWAARNLVYDKPDADIKPEGPLFRLPTAGLMGVGVIAFCCMLGEGAMGDWSGNYMKNIAHAEDALAPIGLSAFAMAMTLGRIFGDRARTALGDKILITTGGITATAGLSIVLIFPEPEIAIAGFFAVGLGLSTIVPIAYSLAGNTKNLPPGVGLAMVTTVGYSGFLFGPPIIGFLADWQTLRIALVLVVLLLLTMTVLGLRYKVEDTE